MIRSSKSDIERNKQIEDGKIMDPDGIIKQNKKINNSLKCKYKYIKNIL